MLIRPLLALLILALTGSALAGGKKPDPIQVSFHIEGAATDGPKLAFSQGIQGKNIIFRRSPIIQTINIAAYRPFPAADGSYGATFLLERGFHQRLAAETNQNVNKWLLAMFNGRPVDAVRIDAPVRDGQLVIWQGINLVEVQRMSLKWPFIGETAEEWKARKKLVKQNLK